MSLLEEVTGIRQEPVCHVEPKLAAPKPSVKEIWAILHKTRLNVPRNGSQFDRTTPKIVSQRTIGLFYEVRVSCSGSRAESIVPAARIQ